MGEETKHEHDWIPTYVSRHSSDFVGDYFIVEFTCQTLSCEAELYEYCEAKRMGEGE